MRSVFSNIWTAICIPVVVNSISVLECFKKSAMPQCREQSARAERNASVRIAGISGSGVGSRAVLVALRAHLTDLYPRPMTDAPDVPKAA